MSDRLSLLLGLGIAALAMLGSWIGLPPWAFAVAAGCVTTVFLRRIGRRLAAATARIEAHHERALRWREEQLANTAHELRTPLTSVTTAIELMRDGYATSPEDFGMFLDQASTAARHMAFLINDVVDLAAIEGGRISLQIRTQRVVDLLADIDKVMSLPAQMRDVGLEIQHPEEELHVTADRGRFLQVAFNMVANAIKFSGTGSQVSVRVEVADRKVRFEVHDEGPGVSVDRRERLFTRFGRAHEDSLPAVAGTGLGLYVSRMLVAHMGGEIGYRAREPHGSVFWFTLPRVVANPRAAAAALAAVGCADPAQA